jgi:hypothetical protein
MKNFFKCREKKTTTYAKITGKANSNPPPKATPTTAIVGIGSA